MLLTQTFFPVICSSSVSAYVSPLLTYPPHSFFRTTPVHPVRFIFRTQGFYWFPVCRSKQAHNANVCNKITVFISGQNFYIDLQFFKYLFSLYDYLICLFTVFSIWNVCISFVLLSVNPPRGFVDKSVGFHIRFRIILCYVIPTCQ